ncbi:hypothetical protein FSP39_021390 [Pinctada imbricata]|uniref:VWFD domain-containing protein n=1 Tax=Pinctada imbricata TaxID=66713 RepID=A0AA88YHM6_PINIB|nr:hypothetical protein FSP39_021390 [Pinctada imbricata]
MSCGGGHQKYVRYCNNPRPRYGGTSCVGNSIKYNECNTQNCPVNGGWSPWSSYGPCSKTCGRGTHTQTRTCSAPSPTYGGRKCSGRTTRSRQCNTQKCPIDGGWSAWRKYGRCSKTCGRGKQYLVRYCDTPTPRYNGKMCEGKNIQFEICNTKKCPVHGAWSDWSSYGDCSKTCGGGIQTQRRKCKEPKYGGRKCIGRSSRKRRCNIQKCPETCKCIAMGDPHYKTYDGQMIHFQGICKYLLTELTYKYDPCWFSVSVQNENRGSKRVSYTKMVEIETQGIKISLGKKGLVQVNGARVYLPYDKQEKIRIYRSGFDVCVETSCGQVITWNQRFTVTVTVDGKYRKQLRGICGDCNGIKDDFKTQQGVDVTNMPNRYSLIGKSWRIKDGSDAEKCTPIRPPAECTEKMREKAMRNDSCGFINPKKKDSSPFKKCIEKDKEAAQEVFENCVYDYCTYAKKSQWELRIAICNAVEGFAETCKDYGIAVKWRSETFCPIPCGKNQVYRYETSACPSTCVDPEAPDTCELPDVEGCECREGYALSDDKCVRLSKCGCFSDGKYYPVGKRVKLCKKELYCKMRRGRPVLQVTIITCSQYSVCKQIRGQYQCVCKEGYIGNGRSCEPEGCGGKRCHKFAICYKNQCRCKNGYNGDGVEVCDGGCQVRRQSSPQCGVTYRLSGTCHFTSEMRDDCQYTVDLYKSKAGRAQADLKYDQVQNKGGDPQQHQAAVPKAKPQYTQCKNTEQTSTGRDAKGPRNVHTQHRNIIRKGLHINQQDQRATDVDLGRPSATKKAEGSDWDKHVTCAIVTFNINEAEFGTSYSALRMVTRMAILFVCFLSDFDKFGIDEARKLSSTILYITNFPFLSSNIPSSPAYVVFISQVIRYARASTKYTDFVLRARRLSDKLLSQGYVCDRLTSSLRKFYGRYGELVIHYDVPLSRMLDNILS